VPAGGAMQGAGKPRAGGQIVDPAMGDAGGARPWESAAYRDRRYYGRAYHLLFDRALDASRSAVVDLVPEGASVLDIACGTGDLCFALRREKRCRVVGIDLSQRMLRFAAKRNPYEDVSFAMLDATDLSGFICGAFDCATVTLLLHELPREARTRVLTEALRVARTVIVADWTTPLPSSLEGLSVRFIEWAGRHHYRSFKDYLARGGIDGIIKDLRALEPQVALAHREVLKSTCREIVALSRRREAAA
jgi:SAM-dependent methyltransferase